MLEVWKLENAPVLISNRPCGLQLFRVAPEERDLDPTLYEYALGHRRYHPAEREGPKSDAED
jgi:hypothetical protein